MNKFETACNEMNVEQREIFDMVTESFKKQLKGSDVKLKIFISGESGVGKTFLMNLLKNQINLLYEYNGYQPAVVACAPTGVAALGIEGSTVHAAFMLPFDDQKDIDTSQVVTESLFKKWKNIEFVLIDEVSMMSYEMLNKIDSRLRQFKNYMGDQHFGNINMILCGDLLQLPPVSKVPIYRKTGSSAEDVHLWRLFELFELKQNMRPKKDAFLEVLNAVRIGEIKERHFLELENRLIGDHEFDSNAVGIFPTWNQVNAYNERMINHLERQGAIFHIIEAIDTKLGEKTFKKEEDDSAIMDTAEAQNTENEKFTESNVKELDQRFVINGYDDRSIERILPKKLKLCVGAKVMLRYNIDIEQGLVNGAIGVVKELFIPQVCPHPVQSVLIDFGEMGTHLIHPITRIYNIGGGETITLVERQMLPIILSWARTIHMTQGTTIQNAIVYLGDKIFSKGQAYAALSSVESFEGLSIHQLNRIKLSDLKLTNTEAMEELERMKWNKRTA